MLDENGLASSNVVYTRRGTMEVVLANEFKQVLKYETWRGCLSSWPIPTRHLHTYYITSTNVGACTFLWSVTYDDTSVKYLLILTCVEVDADMLWRKMPSRRRNYL